jgi:uncharacterized protein YabN with tetrapyrrole methylase and pyrophosphatase domain
MNTTSRLPYDIAVVGLGITGTHQITREVEETIRRSRQTFVIDMAVSVIDYLKTLCPDVVDLMHAQKVGSHRRLIYRRMASTVIAAALEKPPVCFATYGHPKMYCHPTTLIQRAARVLDLKVEVFPGVSSLDTLLVDLNVDPGFDGLQVYDATDLIVRRRPLQNDVSCVIMQAPIVLEAFNNGKPPKRDNLQLLQNYLLEFYPPDQKVVIVISKTHPLVEPVTQKLELGNLATALQKGLLVGTLFIPPVKHRDVVDQKLADKMKIPDAKPGSTPTKPRRKKPGKRYGKPKIGPQQP